MRPPDKQRSGPRQEAAPEIVATTKQLDLCVEDSSDGDASPRTEPDPARRRRNLEGGRRRADDGASAVLANTLVGPRDVAERCLRELASEGIEFDAETLRDRMRGHVLGAHPNAIAAVIRKAAADRLIVCVGVTTASRPEARGRLIRRWRGTGRPS